MPLISKDIVAVFRKEWKSESRTLSGLTTTGLLCFVCVVIANNITFTASITPIVGAGLYWMILVFSAAVSLPRTFLQEEETKTVDFWHLVARPEAVFWGKALFNIAQMLIAAIVMSFLFVVMLKMNLAIPWLFIATGLGGAVAIGSTVTLAGAIAAPANNRNALAAAISVPLLVFLVNLGVTGTATAFGEGLRGGQNAAVGMLAYAVAMTALGPVIYSKLWKN